MYISTEINSFSKYGEIKSVLKLLKDSGFDAYDFSMFAEKWLGENSFLASDDYLGKAKDLRVFADTIGLVCNQAHAPFPTVITEDILSVGVYREEYNARMRVQIERAIEVAGILGVKVLVVHPCNHYNAEQNATLYKSFEGAAKKAGVKIGVENMWNWKSGEQNASAAACSHHDDFKAHLDLLPKDVFVACIDIGHSEMAGLNTSVKQMIETLGDRVQALHIHDNDKIHDSHALPFTARIDFEEMISELKKIGYTGDVTMEADSYIKNFPLELYPQATWLLAEVAKYFRKKLQN